MVFERIPMFHAGKHGEKQDEWCVCKASSISLISGLLFYISRAHIPYRPHARQADNVRCAKDISSSETTLVVCLLLSNENVLTKSSWNNKSRGAAAAVAAEQQKRDIIIPVLNMMLFVNSNVGWNIYFLIVKNGPKILLLQNMFGGVWSEDIHRVW